MNKEEQPINPGRYNPIYELSRRQTQFDDSVFVGGTIEDMGLNFEYTVDHLPEYERLQLTITYVVRAIETDYHLSILTFTEPSK